MSKYNLKTIIVGLIILAVGLLITLLDAFVWNSKSSVVLNIGCSLLASSLVILLTTFLVDFNKPNPLDEWGITKIYSTRAEKNVDSDPQLGKAKYRVDAIAFGLENFRNKNSKSVELCLRNGVNFRILTMDPGGRFIHLREEEESGVNGQIEKQIHDLVTWANDLNNRHYKGRIVVKGYKCMTLDFYWRVDDQLFVGPYWYGQPSNQTITYAFSEGGKGFTQYTDYFEKLWDNDNNTIVLTEDMHNSEPSNMR
jgi:hypothetical protein